MKRFNILRVKQYDDYSMLLSSIQVVALTEEEYKDMKVFIETLKAKGFKELPATVKPSNSHFFLSNLRKMSKSSSSIFPFFCAKVQQINDKL